VVTKQLKVIAVIPARGGSKGIPGKNIKLLGEYPLLAYSIAASLKSKLVNRVFVSTDDEAIAEVGARYGAEVPFRRPAEISGDAATDLPLFEHIITWLKKNENYSPDIIVQLRPTSPFRPVDLVDNSVRLLVENSEADSIRTVALSSENPYKMWRIIEGVMQPLLGGEFDEPYNMPRQKLPKTYWQTGHVDTFRTSTVTKKQSLTGDIILPLLVDHRYLMDLDNLEQWEMAEWILKNRKFNIVTPS
jgi:CMP-N-acetylneuraminic acid synthetase